MRLIIYLLIIFQIAFLSAFSQVTVSPVEFNSGKDDFNSNITQNGKAIYFTSDRKSGKQKVFFVQEVNGKWQSPKEVVGAINDGKESGAVALTSDGQYMLFAAFEHEVGGFGRTDIYSAEKVNGKWTNVKNLGANINSSAWDSQPMISNDGNILLFVSDRPGGYGGTDIYVSFKTANGWSKAENAGSIINSEYDEMTPVLGVDNTNFTFASNRPGGFGEFDIYVSKYKNNRFDKPTNAGEPINSSADDFYYYSMPNSDVAYFSSSRKGGSGNLDIYKAVPNPYESDAVFLLSGEVRDAKNGNLLGANIIITDLVSGEKVADLRSDDKTGEYFVILQQGRTYSITADKEDYLFFSSRYEVPSSKDGSSQTKNIELSPIAGGNTRLLVFFDFDKATLKKESIPELDRVATFLNKYKDVKISLEGHTDDVGAADYNLKLSENRASSVKDYLVKKDIDANRIKTVGFGLTKPLVNDKTESARATNRRVEMKIIQ
ncbi:MAG: OmpA family protein [Candidatus Kapabacteria bacterium]|nr:OmpA family protein [Ignavibacteriota bacterium]MCW5883917.1 OmpA family protein [Candidatus Kapabacteria bacterium]